MNFFPTKQQQHNTEESEAMIRDLEAPLLSEDESSVVNTIHTAVPLLLKTNNDIGIVHHRAHTVHVSPPCQGHSNAASTKVGNVDFVHVSPPCQSYISKENEDNYDDDDDCDTILIDIDSEATIIDARCNLLNGTYLIGFLLGLILQACSLYAVSVVSSSSSASSSATTGTGTTGSSGTSTTSDDCSLSVYVKLALYFFSRYWVLLALLLPPVVSIMSKKFHRSSKARRRANKINIKKNKNKNVNSSCLDTFFECVRFQFGLLFGSLILLSIVNFYTLAKTAPLYMLAAYYGVCVVVSLFALCLLQLFVNQVCANISSVEITVSYDNDEEDDDSDDDDE